jgi:phosphatidylglycerophosphate synthase
LSENKTEIPKAAGDITQGRKRTNILKNLEQKTIEFLCSVMPSWISSDLLTFIGFLGSIIVSIGLYYGKENPTLLMISIIGFAVQWFGDSLDGRLAYYRNKPRKWYGWALDITVDWISIGIIGAGFYYFFSDYQFIAFLFIFTYGWSMINSLLRYKITNSYQIDSNYFGPTELRIIICFFIVLEIFVPGALWYFGLAGSGILAIFNIKDLLSVLDSGNKKDAEDKLSKG